jgi:hypothetical protein
MIYYELLNFMLLKVDGSFFSICIIGWVIFASLASTRNKKINWYPWKTIVRGVTSNVWILI